MRGSLSFFSVIALGALCSATAILTGQLGPVSATVSPEQSTAAAAVDTSSNAGPKAVTEPLPSETPTATPASDPRTAEPPGEDTDGFVSTPETGQAFASYTSTSPVADLLVAELSPHGLEGTTDAPTLPAAVEVEPSVTVDNQKAAELLVHMNGGRAREGVRDLARSSELDNVALARAEDLVGRRYFDHYGPDGSSAFTELALRGIDYRLAGENLARNNHTTDVTVMVAFDALMESPGHRANILEARYREVGVAAVDAGGYWVYVTVFID